MGNSSEIFKKSLDKAASSVTLSPDMVNDMSAIKNSMKENDSDETRLKKSAKKEFSKDLQKDIDYLEFKKRAKYKDRDTEYSFGVPNVTSDDPYISKKKYSRVGKGEPTEATGSGSSGAYSSPLFGDNDFIDKSNNETPKKIEATEATGSGSVGAYETPAMWAKSTKKKDWQGKSHTQIPGGAFVSVKKKCKKFPYCNQGDIKALDIYENKNVKEAIKNVSKNLNISENTIKAILEFEMEKRANN